MYLSRFSTRRFGAVAVLALAAACVSTGAAPGERHVPTLERWIDLPTSDAELDTQLDAVALAHLMRGQHSLLGRSGRAAIAHLRLARLYMAKSPYVHRKLAEAWLAEGELEKAESVLHEAVESHGPAAIVMAQKGALALRRLRYSDAAAALEVAYHDPHERVAVTPLFVDARLWLDDVAGARELVKRLRAQLGGRATPEILFHTAGTLEDHGLWELAAQLYADVAASQPGDREAVLAEVRLHQAMGHPAAALDRLASLFAYYPDDPILYAYMATLQLKVSDAVAYWDEALANSAMLPDLHLHVVGLALLAGYEEAAKHALSQLVRRAPAHFHARAMLVHTYASGATHHPAPVCLQRLDGFPEEGAQIHELRAMCYGHAGAVESMLQEVDLAVRQSPQAPSLMQEVARWLAHHRSEPKARELLRGFIRGLRSATTDLDRWLTWAVFEDVLGNGRAALAYFDRMQQAVPDNVLVLLRQADIRARYGQRKEALQTLVEQYAQRPYDFVRLNALGFTLAEGLTTQSQPDWMAEMFQTQQGQAPMHAAGVWLRRAHRLAPNDVYVLDSLGWYYHLSGDSRRALTLLQRAARGVPHDAEILRHLGVVQERLGDVPGALQTYRRALRALPSKPLRRVLERAVGAIDPGSGPA